jgi:hypothetical protein
MLQITITEIEKTNEMKINADAIKLIEQAEEILDKLLSLGNFENDNSVEDRLTEISTLLFNAHCSLCDKIELAQLQG